jgi:hypothetical protein
VAWTTDRIIGHGVCIAYSFGDGHVAEADRKGNDEQIDCQEASRRNRRYLKVAGPEITGGREFQPHWRGPQEIQWCGQEKWVGSKSFFVLSLTQDWMEKDDCPSRSSYVT